MNHAVRHHLGAPRQRQDCTVRFVPKRRPGGTGHWSLTRSVDPLRLVHLRHFKVGRYFRPTPAPPGAGMGPKSLTGRTTLGPVEPMSQSSTSSLSSIHHFAAPPSLGHHHHQPNADPKPPRRPPQHSPTSPPFLPSGLPSSTSLTSSSLPS